MDNKITVQYINHAGFLISHKRTNIIIDPFLSGKFFWNGHWEIQSGKPKIKFDQIPKIKAILCTHLHGDHLDMETIYKFIQRDKALLIAPKEAINFLIHCSGFGSLKCIPAISKNRIRINDFKIVCLPNKGNEKDINSHRLSFIIEHGNKKIFHSGDSHGFSYEWEKYAGKIDLALLWCEYLEEIIENLKPCAIYLHHFEKFSPGEFSCNKNLAKIINLLRRKFSCIKFYNPEVEKTITL